jgi:hypothetical protein
MPLICGMVEAHFSAELVSEGIETSGSKCLQTPHERRVDPKSIGGNGVNR